MNVLNSFFLGLCIYYSVSQKLPVENNQFTGLLQKIIYWEHTRNRIAATGSRGLGGDWSSRHSGCSPYLCPQLTLVSAGERREIFLKHKNSVCVSQTFWTLPTCVWRPRYYGVKRERSSRYEVIWESEVTAISHVHFMGVRGKGICTAGWLSTSLRVA